MTIVRAGGLLLVVLGAAALWLLFGSIAYDHPDAPHINQGFEWARAFLGLVTVLLGLVGFGRPLVVKDLRVDAAHLGYGAAGLLGGATLMGIGSWGAPLGLFGLVVGGGTLRYLARKHGQAND